MYDIVSVHVSDSFKELKDVVFDLASRNWSLVDDLQQIFLNVFADQIDFAFFSEGLFELDDVFVAQHFEYFDLPENNTLILLVTVIFFELFYGYQLIALLVTAFKDEAVLSLAYSV